MLHCSNEYLCVTDNQNQVLAHIATDSPSLELRLIFDNDVALGLAIESDQSAFSVLADNIWRIYTILKYYCNLFVHQREERAKFRATKSARS